MSRRGEELLNSNNNKTLNFLFLIHVIVIIIIIITIMTIIYIKWKRESSIYLIRLAHHHFPVNI